MAWKSFLSHKVTSLDCYYFITHVHHCVTGATQMEVTLSQTDMLQMNDEP